jgi:hypothetical protein
VAHDIDGSHQHAKSGKLYTYSADFDVAGSDIRWRATVQQSDEVRLRPGGTIATNTPAAGTIAEQAVRDAVIAAIDAFDDVPGI